jgi:helicase
VPVVEGLMSPAQRTAARQVAEELHGGAEEDTEGARRLSALLPHGVAFHNASLTNPERRVVERAFRQGILLALSATPTLAAGINLPARRVVVRDLFRYDDRLGVQSPIPTLEVQQMCGRAGRPRFDTSGEAVLVARNRGEEMDLFDRYLTAPPEDVESRLAAEPALRMHLLALVASGAVADERQLEAFFAETFFGHTRSVTELADTVRTVRDFLEQHDLLEHGRALRATAFGDLTSQLYLDPLSAIVLRGALERAPINVRPFPLLAAVAATPDLPPLFTRRSDERDLLERFTEEEAELLVQPEEEPLNLPLDTFLSTLKTASVLEAWTEETALVALTDRFGVGAGDVHAKVEDADWLLFGASRLAIRFQRRIARPLDALSLRVRYGVKEELLDLVRLRGIGRVRGRLLFDAGYPDRDSLATATVAQVGRVLGSARLAESVLRQLRPGARAGPVQNPPSEAPSPAEPPPPTSKRAPSTSRKTLEEF